jgi:hypothetical protein
MTACIARRDFITLLGGAAPNALNSFIFGGAFS